MGMARRVAAFLTANLRHYNGLPVECVIADGAIGGVAEAARCAEQFRKAGVVGGAAHYAEPPCGNPLLRSAGPGGSEHIDGSAANPTPF